jgi:hypothetical protein
MDDRLWEGGPGSEGHSCVAKNCCEYTDRGTHLFVPRHDCAELMRTRARTEHSQGQHAQSHEGAGSGIRVHAFRCARFAGTGVFQRRATNARTRDEPYTRTALLR